VPELPTFERIIKAGDPDGKEIRTALADWFARAGREELPWRQTDDAYAILVSEFMLQQTTVQAVLPYYRAWLEKFPDFAALARAGEQEVLSAWEGLGYYSRARNLHRLARQITQEYGGKLPEDREKIRALPGVGEYTAGAVASFAFDQPEPALDANISRVLARLLDWQEPLDRAESRKTLNRLARYLLGTGPGGGRAVNSALMDLGATVCLPAKPQCLICPVQRFCQATEPELLPRKPRKTVYEAVEDHRVLSIREGKILLQQSPGPTWRGMWVFPALEEGRVRGLRSQARQPFARAKYAITRFRVTLSLWRIDPGPGDAPPAEGCAEYFLPEDIEQLPLPAPYRKVLAPVLKELRG
jgi:A/G-specific adenine glycosylase